MAGNEETPANEGGFKRVGGRGGIRTHGTVARTSDFESGAFNHSATLPHCIYRPLRIGLDRTPPPNRTTLLTNYRQSYARIESYTTPGPLQAKRHLLGQDPGPIHEGDLAHRRFSVWAAG